MSVLSFQDFLGGDGVFDLEKLPLNGMAAQSTGEPISPSDSMVWSSDGGVMPVRSMLTSSSIRESGLSAWFKLYQWYSLNRWGAIAVPPFLASHSRTFPGGSVPKMARTALSSLARPPRSELKATF